jgi:hypothetical protein
MTPFLLEDAGAKRRSVLYHQTRRLRHVLALKQDMPELRSGCISKTTRFALASLSLIRVFLDLCLGGGRLWSLRCSLWES